MKNTIDEEKITTIMQRALNKAATQLKEEIIQEQIIPYDTGKMQKSLRIDRTMSKEGLVTIVIGGEDRGVPYAKRLFYHPEYNFQRTHNKNAQGEYFLPWINGKYKNRAKELYEEKLKELLGGKNK